MASAAAASSLNMIGGGGAAQTKAGSSGVESLPKEMHDMKLRDDKVDHSDDKVSKNISFHDVCGHDGNSRSLIAGRKVSVSNLEDVCDSM